MCWSTALEKYFSSTETLVLGRVAIVLYTCTPLEKVMEFSSQKGRDKGQFNSHVMKEYLLKREWLTQLIETLGKSVMLKLPCPCLSSGQYGDSYHRCKH